MLHDLRYAIRAMLRRPAFTAVVVLCLALGIGANGALFGVIDAILFRPPAGVGRPDGVVRVDIRPADDPALRPRGGLMLRRGATAASYPDFTDLRDRTNVFSAVAAYATARVTLGTGESAEQLSAILASGAYFALLDVKPALGRFFLPEADHQAEERRQVAVLSDDFWRRRFGADPHVIGQSLLIEGKSFTIAGVAPPGFTGADLATPDVWLPLLSTGGTAGLGAAMTTSRAMMWLRVLARLAPGVSLARATTATLDVVHAGDEEASPGKGMPIPPRGPGLVLRGITRTASLVPISTHIDRAAGQESPVPLWLLAVTGTVLLIACANVASLLLARGAARRREIAIRLSIGASQGRLVRHLLTESVLLALLAGVAGVVIAAWSARLLHLLPIPPIAHPVDGRIIALTMALALATSLLFGLAPALHAARTGPGGVLRDETDRASAHRTRLRNGLTIAQIALSLVLLVGAGLFFRSLRNVRAIDTGYDLDHVLIASVNLNSRGYSDAAAADFYRRATERVRALPGIDAAALAEIIPFRMTAMTGISIPGRESPTGEPIIVSTNAVEPDYFRAMGVPLRAGRLFTAADREGSSPVAIINETMARRYWPDESAIGKCIDRRGAPSGSANACMEVVGVVRDAKYGDLQEGPTPHMYTPLAQSTHLGGALLHIRTRGAPEQSAAAVRRAIQTLEPNVPFVDVYPLATTLRSELLPWQIGTTAFTIFGALALTLAAVGLYGVIAFLVTQRTREVGIRMALGAQRGDVLALVLGHALRLTALGVGVGLVLAVALLRLLQHRMYGVSTADPLTLAGVALVLAAVAVAASALPALRAARVDPMIALRHE
jgi:predicted permease